MQIPQQMNYQREFHATVCVGNYLYVFGGSNSLASGTVYLNSAERLDLNNLGAGWQVIASMPTPRTAIAGTSDNQERIYVIGGHNGVNSFGVVERYDPSNGTWQVMPPLQQVRSRCGVARDQNGLIYAIGGAINFGALTSVERFDPANPLSWQAAAAIPQVSASQSVTAATAPSGDIYALVNITASNQCLRYDSFSNQWQTLPVVMPTPIHVEASSTVFDATGHLWAIGEVPAPGTVPVTTTYILSGLATVTDLGSGCAGSAGIPLLRSTLPVLGSTAQLSCQNLAQNNITFLAMGLSDTSWTGVPLPLNLGLIGMPGCWLRVSPDTSQWRINFAGFVYFQGIAIPNSASWIGIQFYAQVLGVDPGLNPFGATTSNALTLAVGI